MLFLYIVIWRPVLFCTKLKLDFGGSENLEVFAAWRSLHRVDLAPLQHLQPHSQSVSPQEFFGVPMTLVLPRRLPLLNNRYFVFFSWVCLFDRHCWGRRYFLFLLDQSRKTIHILYTRYTIQVQERNRALPLSIYICVCGLLGRQPAGCHFIDAAVRMWLYLVGRCRLVSCMFM